MVRRWVAENRGYWLAVAAVLSLGTWVLWPALRAGPITDDVIADAMMDGAFAAPRHPLDLFTFATGEPQDLRAVQRLGSLPYWAHPELRLSFMRPLASVLLHVDRMIFGDQLFGHHLHSLLWWWLLCLATAQFYRSLLPQPVALTALSLFALNDAHHLPVMWLANRGGLVSMCLGIFGLHRLLCHPQRARPVQRAIAFLAFSLSLLCGEWVFPLLGFAIVHLWWPIAPRSAEHSSGAAGLRGMGKRLLVLWPMLVPTGVFLVARALLGYGARGSGIYVDPVLDPLRFLSALVVRAPVLVADVLFDIPAHWWDLGNPWRDYWLRQGWLSPEVFRMLPSWRTAQLAAGVGGLLLFGAAMAVLLRRLPSGQRLVLRHLLVAAILALIPVAGSFPSSRLSLPAWVFAAPGVAYLLVYLVGQLRRAARLSLPRFMMAYLLTAALAFLLIITPLRADLDQEVALVENTIDWGLTAELDMAALPEQHVFIFGGRDFSTTFFLPYLLHYYDRPMPKSCYPLSAIRKPADLLRVSERSFLLRPLSGTFLETDIETFFRDPGQPLRAGERIALPEVTIEVQQLWRGQPLQLRLTFARDLDDPHYVFLHSSPFGLTRVEIPPVDRWIRLPQPVLPSRFGIERGYYERRIGPFPDFLSFKPPPKFLRYRPAVTTALHAPISP